MSSTTEDSWWPGVDVGYTISEPLEQTVMQGQTFVGTYDVRIEAEGYATVSDLQIMKVLSF